MLTKTAKYIKHPIKPTEISHLVLRARLSLRETQPEFAARFMVTPVTVHNWETGKTEHIQLIHKEILKKLVDRLKTDNAWMDEAAFVVIYENEIARRGNARL